MTSPRLVVALAALLAGCSYPEFAFAPGAADAANDTSIAADSASAEVEPADSASADSALEDTTAAVDSASDSMIDALDSALADTTPLTDTGADVVTDSGPPLGCTGSTAVFCQDFDKVTAPATGWSWDYLSAGSSLALEPSGLSAPNALRAEIVPADAGIVNAFLGKELVAPSLDAVARVDVRIKLESPTLPGYSSFLLKYEKGGDGVALAMDSVGLSIDAIASPSSFHRLSFVPTVGKWFHVRLEAKLRLTNGSIKLFIDDMTTPVLDKTGISTLRADSTSRLLLVGLYAESLSAPFRARYDDVQFTWLP